MNKYVYIPLFLVLYVLCGIDAKSGDCSSVNSLVTNEVNDFEVKFNDYEGIGTIAKIDYKYKPATSSSDGIIFIDWSTITNKHPAMSEATLKDFVLNAVIRELGRGYRFEEQIYWDVYSSAPCYSTLNCVYKVDTTRENCCDKSDQTSPINTWEINGEKFMSVPFAKYICSIKCCYTRFRTEKKSSDAIHIRKYGTFVISECSPGPDIVAPHCLLSTDPNSPYYREWDPHPLSSTCEGGCP